MQKSFIAVQTGARRNYRVPSILHQAGMLEAFYTDMCANKGLGSILERLSPNFAKRGTLKQLLNRKLSSELNEKIATFDGVAIRHIARKKIIKNPYKLLQDFDYEFGQAMIRRGLGNATHVFSMFGEGTNFIEFAKKSGLKVVTEVYISPSTARIVQREREKYFDMEPLTLPDSVIRAERFKKVYNYSDLLIIPSSFVEKGLEELEIHSMNKPVCYTVPYVVGDSWLKLNNTPTKGRILFVGTAELRKGIHILGMAASKLKHRQYEFRIAGGVSDLIRQHPLNQNLKFLGRIPRSTIEEEYAQADIFVLPSLAEGSAEVTYEALGAALPVIATEAAGSVVRDGIEGFIVPERDPEALASRIEELVENRALRDRMSIAARERAKEYTWDQYAQTLLTAIDTL